MVGPPVIGRYNGLYGVPGHIAVYRQDFALSVLVLGAAAPGGWAGGQLAWWSGRSRSSPEPRRVCRRRNWD